MPKYKLTKQGAVTTVKSASDIKLMITSDIHFDSQYCYREMFFEDIIRAIDSGYKIAIIGDFFDAMQGRFDPRRDMSKVRPEYRVEKYYDALVEDAISHLTPYQEHILMITYGNHETSVLKNANTDLIDRLTKGLSTKKHKVHSGGYGGVMMLSTKNRVVPAKYFHGSGGEAPVTRGAIQTNRQAVFLPDFQIIMNGHSHNSYWIPIVRERVTNDGEHYFDIQHHIRTAGYSMPYGDGSKGWEVSRGGVPKPIGSCFIDVDDNDIYVTPLIHAPIPFEPENDQYEGPIFPQE